MHSVKTWPYIYKAVSPSYEVENVSCYPLSLLLFLRMNSLDVVSSDSCKVFQFGFSTCSKAPYLFLTFKFGIFLIYALKIVRWESTSLTYKPLTERCKYVSKSGSEKKESNGGIGVFAR